MTHWARPFEKVGSNRSLRSFAKVKLPICEHCLAGKAIRLPFGKVKRVTSKLQLIHSDIYGLMNVKARHDANYFIIFIDDFTRFGHIYLITSLKHWIASLSSPDSWRIN